MLVYCQIHSSPFRRRLQQWTPFCFYCHPVVRETYRNDLEKVTRLVSSFFPTHSHTHHSLASYHFIPFRYLIRIPLWCHSSSAFSVLLCNAKLYSPPAEAAHTNTCLHSIFWPPPHLKPSTLSLIWRRRRSCAATQRTGAKKPTKFQANSHCQIKKNADR